MHKGDLLHSSEIRKEASDMHKIQCVFEQDEEAFCENIFILSDMGEQEIL